MQCCDDAAKFLNPALDAEGRIVAHNVGRGEFVESVEFDLVPDHFKIMASKFFATQVVHDLAAVVVDTKSFG